MLEKEKLDGYFIAVDGPNGVGKSTLIEAIKNKLEVLGYAVYITREPTDTKLGNFLREFAEKHSGRSLACLVAADRYEHMTNEIIPALEEGQLVISDRYILSSLDWCLEGICKVLHENVKGLQFPKTHNNF